MVYAPIQSTNQARCKKKKALGMTGVKCKNKRRGNQREKKSLINLTIYLPLYSYNNAVS